MRKALIALLIFSSIYSCQTQSNKDSRTSVTDSLERAVKIEHMADSIIKSASKNAALSSADKSDNAYIKIISSRIIKPEYSNYRSIRITYKNISGKKISAIRFGWYGENAFGEPADMGGDGVTDGYGNGSIDSGLAIGETKTSEWDILSRNAKKIIRVWVKEIAFEDGTKWEPNN